MHSLSALVIIDINFGTIILAYLSNEGVSAKNTFGNSKLSLYRLFKTKIKTEN